MGLLIDPEGLNQHKYYEGKEQAADNCVDGFSKQRTMFRQQDSTTRKQMSVLVWDTSES